MVKLYIFSLIYRNKVRLHDLFIYNTILKRLHAIIYDATLLVHSLRLLKF